MCTLAKERFQNDGSDDKTTLYVTDLLHRPDDSEEVTFVIAPLDKMSKTADRAQAQDAVPIIYSRIMFQPMIKATNSPTV